jgi:glutaredoxin 3
MVSSEFSAESGTSTNATQVEEGKVVMYSTTVCPYCQMAERLLKARGVEHVEKILIDREPGRREEMMARTGRRTVPQVFIGQQHVGGFDDLSALDRRGGLVPLLQTI